MRQPLPSLLLAAALAVPTVATTPNAHADVVGASAKYHGGFQKTAKDTSWVTGAEVALQILGFELFADVRLFENHVFFEDSQPKSDWYWDRIGLRLDIGLPFSFGADNADVFVDGAYISSRRPVALADPLDQTPHKDDKGLAAGGGLRFDYGLFGPVYFTLQPEIGFDLLIFGPPEAELKPYLSGLAAINLDI